MIDKAATTPTASTMRTTSMRFDATLLRTARLLLDIEGRSVNDLCVEALTDYVRQHIDRLDVDAMRAAGQDSRRVAAQA